MFSFKTIAVAGTFDHLHKGHEFFLSEAFKIGEKVVVGLTSDDFARKKILSHLSNLSTLGNLSLQSYSDREKALRDFLQQKGLLDRAKIIAIDDIYGPAVEDGRIEALAVTPESWEGGRLVNRKRRENGLKLLKILQIPIVMAQDRRKISSSRIRFGEIDRWGKVFGRLNIWGKRIPDNFRITLKEPIGKLVKGSCDNLLAAANQVRSIITATRPILVCTVGDEATKMCNQIGIAVNLAVFDFKVRRVKIYNSISDLGFISPFARGPLANPVVTVRNPAGNITKTLLEAVRKSIKGFIQDRKTKLIKVVGEDDLAALPVILLSPLNSIVLYGQPDRGVVVVKVTEEVKTKLLEMIQKYS